jgi:hypothetical protein
MAMGLWYEGADLCGQIRSMAALRPYMAEKFCGGIPTFHLENRS